MRSIRVDAAGPRTAAFFADTVSGEAAEAIGGVAYVLTKNGVWRS